MSVETFVDRLEAQIAGLDQKLADLNTEFLAITAGQVVVGPKPPVVRFAEIVAEVSALMGNRQALERTRTQLDEYGLACQREAAAHQASRQLHGLRDKVAALLVEVDQAIRHAESVNSPTVIARALEQGGIPGEALRVIRERYAAQE